MWEHRSSFSAVQGRRRPGLNCSGFVCIFENCGYFRLHSQGMLYMVFGMPMTKHGIYSLHCFLCKQITSPWQPTPPSAHRPGGICGARCSRPNASGCRGSNTRTTRIVDRPSTSHRSWDADGDGTRVERPNRTPTPYETCIGCCDEPGRTSGTPHPTLFLYVFTHHG